MDVLRYWLALLVVVGFPGAIATWLLIHGFIAFWRRVGAGVTYSVVGALTVAGWAGMFAIRDPLLRVEFGARVPLMVVGAVLYLTAASIEVLCWKHLTLRTLVGIPEVLPTARGTSLLQEGIYGRMRHPRYVGWALGLVAVSLVSNYLATYALTLLFVPAIFLITVLEERELGERFGDAYAAYRRRVPRFLPRLRPGPSA